MLDNLVCGSAKGADLIERVNQDPLSYKANSPDGFNWPIGLPVVTAYRVGDNYHSNIKVSDIVDPSQFTNVLYVDINMPDSSGDGSSWVNAKKGIGQAIDTAISSGVPTLILVKGGVYPRFYGFSNSGAEKVLTANICIKSVYGNVLTGAFDDHVYTKTVGYNNIYEVARSNACAAFNPSTGGAYKLVGSLGECDSTPMSMYTDNANVYIHTEYSSAANNANTRITLNALGAQLSGDYDVCMSGFSFYGGNNGALTVKDGSSNNVITENCKFSLAMSGSVGSYTAKDGVQVLGCGLFIGINSEASNNSKDGFNIHEQGTVKPSSITINCSGFDNGNLIPSQQSCNGLTLHDGCKGIDIGGKWLGSVGTNAGHVNDGTQVWHFGAIAGNSDGDTYNGGSIYFGAFGGWSGSCEIWLDSCVDINSRISMRAGAGATVRYRNHTFNGIIDGNCIPY